MDMDIGVWSESDLRTLLARGIVCIKRAGVREGQTDRHRGRQADRQTETDAETGQRTRETHWERGARRKRARRERERSHACACVCVYMLHLYA